MGGGYYDRDVSSTTTEYSNQSEIAMKKSDKLKEELNPFQKKLTCKNANPIICAIDVTGSMGDWSKIIWDKLPMFYGQIMIQNYLSDPSISFAAIGDSRCDEAPLQITEFAQGSAIDDWISKLWLEGGGGAQHYETYELAAYYYAKHCSIPNAHYSKIKPFFFLTGDEGFYPAVRIDDIAHMFGDHIRAGITSEEIFTELKSKFNVFLLHKPYSIEKKELRILAQWQHVLGSSHVIILQEPKAVVDLMLGIIAIVSKSRTLETYIKDMQERGQTAHRIYLVRKALSELAEEVATNQLTLNSHSKSDEHEKDEELQKIKNYFLEFPQKIEIKKVKTVLQYGASAKLPYIYNPEGKELDKYSDELVFNDLSTLISNQFGKDFLSSSEITDFLIKSGTFIFPLSVLDDEPEILGFKTELLSYKTREAYSDKISPLESHLLRGADAVKKHEFRRALTHFEQAQNLDMNNAYLWHRKISCLSRLHNYEEALEEIDKLLIKFPRYFKAMLRKGITLFWMARYRESLLQFYQVALNGLPHLKSAAALYARKSILCIFGEDSFIQYQPPDSIFHKLPYLLLLREIFPHFDARTLGRACKVCYLFRYLGETPILWRNLVYANFSKPDGQPSNWRTYYLAKLTQKANSLGYISISSSLLYQCVHCSTKFRSTDSRVCSSSLTHQHEISY